MIYCLNPTCEQPQNPDTHKFCQTCGAQLLLLLRGRYRIKSAIGQGGFGKTYLAEDEERCQAHCVVKQFAPAAGMASNPQGLQKAAELFNEEAKRLLQLEEHPQIPTLYAFFQENNYLYLVQQFVKGKTLMEEFEEKGAFSENQITELLGDLLPVLDFVHQRGVIHRDIKPENIIRRQSDGKLILIDFGVAKQAAGTLLTRQQGTTVGTHGYAPMEQMRGVVYPASDLYSLAVTCVRLMTGEFPKADGSDALYDVIEARWMWRENLPLGASVSVQLGQILDKLLKDYVKERYQSAAEVLAALKGSASTAPAALPKTNPPTAPAAPPKTNPPNPLSISLSKFEFEVVIVDAGGKEINRQRCQAELFGEDLGGGVTLEMVSIPGGTFMMGSPESEKGRYERESPQHRVSIAPFFMGKYPVTQAQWRAVAALPQVKISLKPEPSRFKGDTLPVEQVSWEESVEFCARLSKKTGRAYRLPSEAEWEYACRAGTTTPFHFGETITPSLANYDGNYPYANAPKGTYRQKTTPVGSFAPNTFGLYDMHENVWEWCADPWHENYKGAPSDGSVWESGGNKEYRVRRGGSWNYNAVYCRCAYRYRNSAGVGNNGYGFRVAIARLLSAS